MMICLSADRCPRHIDWRKLKNLWCPGRNRTAKNSPYKTSTSGSPPRVYSQAYSHYFWFPVRASLALIRLGELSKNNRSGLYIEPLRFMARHSKSPKRTHIEVVRAQASMQNHIRWVD